MARSQRGDREAYAALMRELAPVVEAFVRARFGGSPFVDDCVQEALLSVHRGFASYDPRRPFRPWFFAIVRRRLIDCLRADAKRRLDVPLDDSFGAGAATPAEDPARPIDGGRILARLRPDRREALVMTKFCGLSLAEAATGAGVSESAMKTRVHRAVRDARRELEKESAATLFGAGPQSGAEGA